MHPSVYAALADERIAEFRREAAADRLASLVVRPQRPTLGSRPRPRVLPGPSVWTPREG